MNLSLPTYSDRRWLADEVLRWLTEADAERILCIQGGPGTGKSRFLSALLGGSTGASLPSTLGVVSILRDPGGDVDPLLWTILQRKLEEILPPIETVQQFRQFVEIHQHISNSSGIAGAQLDITNGGPLNEFQRLVLPRIVDLPNGPPILIVIDGVDEAQRERAEEILDIISRLADLVSSAPNRLAGLGRLRLLVATQPLLQLELSRRTAIRRIDLDHSRTVDRPCLEAHIVKRLSEFVKPPPPGLAQQLVERSEGVWLWADLAISALEDDYMMTKTIPSRVSVGRGLPSLYQDAVERILARAGESRGEDLKILGVLAAAQEAETIVDHDQVRAMLGCLPSQVDVLMRRLAPIVIASRQGVRFRYRDVAEWILSNGYRAVDPYDGHFAKFTYHAALESRRWTGDGGTSARAAILHCRFLMTYTLGTPEFVRWRQNFIDLLLDENRADADIVDTWVNHVLPASPFLCGGLTNPRSMHRLALNDLVHLLERRVGEELTKGLVEAQLNEFERVTATDDEDAGRAWLERTIPDYKAVVRKVTLELLHEFNTGCILRADRINPQAQEILEGSACLNRWLACRSQTTELDRAVDLLAQAAAPRTPTSHTRDAMRTLIRALSFRLGIPNERDSDLTDIILAERWLSDTAAAGSPDDTLVDSLADRLVQRWERDETEHAPDLDEAVDLLEEALPAAAAEDTRQRMQISLANALISRVGSQLERPGDMDRLIEVQRRVVADIEDRGHATMLLAQRLRQRWERDETEHAPDLDEAVDLLEEALPAATAEDTRQQIQVSLANALISRVGSQLERPGDMDRLIEVQRRVVADIEDPGHATMLLADRLVQRWEQNKAEHALDLDEAVDLLEEALPAATAEDTRQRMQVSLANALISRIGSQLERPGDMDRLIEVQRLILIGAKEPGHVAMLLADRLVQRWERDETEHAPDLDEAVDLLEEALPAATAEDPRQRMQVSLANGLRSRVGSRLERAGDLDRLIEVQRLILTGAADSPMVKRSVGRSLARSLTTSFDRDPEKGMAELREAITYQEAQVVDKEADQHDTDIEYLLSLHVRMLSSNPSPTATERAVSVLEQLQRDSGSEQASSTLTRAMSNVMRRIEISDSH
jgi:hypothetical protein